MHWIKINISTNLEDMIGKHVLVKGRNNKTGKQFYTTGYVARYDGDIILEREEDHEGRYVDCVRTFSDHCEYWFIDIDKIEDSR